MRRIFALRSFGLVPRSPWMRSEGSFEPQDELDGIRPQSALVLPRRPLPAAAMAAALLRRAIHLRRVLPSPTSPLPAASAHRLLSSSTPTSTASQQIMTTPIDLSSDESRRRLVNRLVYRSKQRGFLELDLVLGSWVEQHVHAMDEANIRALLQVLDLENPDCGNGFLVRSSHQRI